MSPELVRCVLHQNGWSHVGAVTADDAMNSMEEILATSDSISEQMGYLLSIARATGTWHDEANDIYLLFNVLCFGEES